MNYNPKDMYNSVVDYVAEHGKSIKRNTLIGITLLAAALYAGGCQNVESTRGKDGKITPQALERLTLDAEEQIKLNEQTGQEGMVPAHLVGWTF